MKEQELLSAFLSGFPESYHPYDRERFLNYAIECAKNGHSIDSNAMLNHGIREEIVHDYEIAFEWIRDTYDKINR